MRQQSGFLRTDLGVWCGTAADGRPARSDTALQIFLFCVSCIGRSVARVLALARQARVRPLTKPPM